MLKVENLSFSYGKIRAVSDISFEVGAGEVFAIIGANGAGKSSLMKCIAGLNTPQSGNVLLEGKRLPSIPHRVVESGVSLVPEGRWIFPNITVEENLLMGGYTVKDRDPGLKRSYEMFPILYDRRNQRAGTMSGGEQQMLAMARGMMSSPKVLLLDEPSLGLAPLIVNEIMRIITMINEEGVSVLLVEQNAKKALKIAKHACVMEQGKIILRGTGEELLNNPKVVEAYLGGAKKEPR